MGTADSLVLVARVRARIVRMPRRPRMTYAVTIDGGIGTSGRGMICSFEFDIDATSEQEAADIVAEQLGRLLGQHPKIQVINASAQLFGP
jgi:hypothetical protein